MLNFIGWQAKFIGEYLVEIFWVGEFYGVGDFIYGYIFFL